MKIRFDHLLVLAEIFKSVPERSPARHTLIEEYAKEMFALIQNDKHFYVNIWDECKDECFVINRDNLMKLESKIVQLLFHVKKLDGNSLTPKILIPTEHRCCGKKIKIESKFATPIVYDINSIFEAKVYHGKCNECQMTFYHGYSVNAEGARKFDDEKGDVFIFNSGIAFTWHMMNYIDSMVTIGAVTFEKIAGVYENSCGKDVKINPDRFENAWFVFRIIKHIKIFPLWPRKNKSKELHLEELCRLVYPQIKFSVDTKWIHHICNEIGCKQRLIVIDGNEKLYQN